MLNAIIEFSVRNKLIVGLFVIGLIFYGGYQTTKLPIDAVPDITNNQVQVITVAPSFGATDIERLVTFPIEQANSNIKGIKEIRSFSRFGLSLVTIVFNDDIDVYWARQQVAERLQQVQTIIPPGIGTPELGPISTGLGEIYQYVVRPEKGYENKYDETELRTIQDWIVRRQLLGVEGVAEVSSFGGKLKQYEVTVDPNKLQSFNITIHDVFNALEQGNQNTGGAYIEKGSTVLFIRSEGLIGSKEDIESISIKSTESGSPIFIRDVAEINIGYATRYGAMTYNDEGEVSGAVVMMLKDANSSEVIKNVKERIAIIQKTLPEGVIIEPFLDRTKMVNNAISTVEKNLLEGALIVVFILVLFLGNFRAGLLVASVIPLAMLFAIILMNTFKVSGNLMSLGALDFGLIVDGAVIIVEAVMHQISHGNRYGMVNRLTQSNMDDEVKKSASKMMNSAVFGQIIILIVYLPILTLQGIEGKMFKPMAQTVAFALLGAFILSVTYIPMMSAWFLSKKVKHKPNLSDRVMNRIERSYQNLLSKILRFPKAVLGTVIVLFITAVFILSRLGGEFIPALEEGDFAVDTRVLTGSNLNTTIESTTKAAHILKTQFPEVLKVVTKIGSGEVPTDPMPMEASDLMVILKDKEEWTSAETFNELAEKMGKALQDVPGITTGFQYPVQMRFNELMTGARQDVVLKIFGEDLDTLAKYADNLGKIVTTVEGSQDLFIEPVTGMPQIVIEYNRATIAQYGLKISDINKVVNTAFAGQSTGLVFEGEKRFNLVVRLNTERRKDLEDVRNLLIPTPQGSNIPLYQLAQVEIKDGPNQIQREDAKRRIVVGFNARGRDVQSIVNELQLKVDEQIRLPVGYYITYGGAFENLNAAKQRLMIAVPISLLLIFLLLFFAFNSVKHGLIIYTAIPLSAIGGIFFLALRGMPFSISAGIGFIALFGVAVLNGIVLIAEFNRLKTSGLKNLNRIVLMGTKTRLRPVMMTAFVASLGFLPMALSSGAGAEVQKPLATVVIGGLIIATLLTLFVLPILYIIFEKTGKSKISKIPAGLLLLIAFSGILEANGQERISLQAAIDTALKNNLSVKNEKLKAEYQQKLISSSANIPQANLSTEFGQINSNYNDNRFGLSQSFSFPTVYSNQKKVLNEEWKASVLSVSLKEAEIKKAVSQIYHSIVILREKEKLLLQADSIYSEFVKKANLRFKTGESNVLEKATAQSQRGGIFLQLKSLQEEIQLANLQMALILNSANRFEPMENSLRMDLPAMISFQALEEHPLLKISDQQKIITAANTRLERSKMLPDLSLGYFNTSIQGTGADNILYSQSKRFNSGHVGIGIPIFAGAQKARVNASRVSEMIADNEYQNQLQTIKNQYQSAKSQYESYLEAANYFEKNSLPEAKIISQTADKQFINGEINYLDWVMLNNQAIVIRNNYLDIIKALNESIINLNYLGSKQ
ncbi:MAG: CusA/CzcA family heavy metal efflux RND transporter [Sphingobacteriales bacterium 17-39-43]|uniref:CusA/CzcA family heavy metal efflux RND transporter n=1 Tax=Daejeonella sp. TaxID=2805397 RepID=UPI000BCA0A30|nr:CusA/CzcA family heavy metal efflux RND transporter [Daejeonella sp.]OYZ31275.1 MAG: CusA/CzcA family heavy metal efflux RND transporter [Sphingobacteriales bacterium 16-39-50]OZA24154.1 MAG: CusA/CzcA family heavy metal efflux RND transporter [Sphingobacteriales bacterium 17-39-43]HQS04632.1 CusA/CzcA family heavy metal efflux RND transporter [Daejeonella sp.]HQT24635.1 CusA/CzcA family heavy metal efflux RND transporter [Daejeonella sp.]HQT58005.1 CusA/CzcA family heavy metal efflux RND t